MEKFTPEEVKQIQEAQGAESAFDEKGRPIAAVAKEENGAENANKKNESDESSADKRIEDLQDAIIRKAGEMKGLDPQSPEYREKEEQWTLLRKEFLGLEKTGSSGGGESGAESKAEATGETAATKENMPGINRDLQQRFAEVKREILQKAREMSAAKARMEAARKLGDKTSFLENQYSEAVRAWEEKDNEYKELERKLAAPIETAPPESAKNKPGEVANAEEIEKFVPAEAYPEKAKDVKEGKEKKTSWGKKLVDFWSWKEGPREKGGFNKALVDFWSWKEGPGGPEAKKAAKSKKEALSAGETREKVWGWTKERLKGLATFGFWEVHRAEQFRSAKKKVGKELLRKSEDVRRTKNLSLEDAWDEALKIQANLEMAGFAEGKGARSAHYEALSESVSREKKAENKIYIDYLVINAERLLRERLKTYQNEFGKNVLDERRVKESMNELKKKLISLEDGALELDVKDFSKVIKEKLDPKYLRRWIYGGAEAALDFAGWQWISGKAASWWYGGEKVAETAVGPAHILPDKIPMDQNIWNTVKDYLTQNGIPNPTDQQVMEGSKIIAHDNGIGVKLWEIKGSPLDTGMQQGHLLKFGTLAKKIALIKSMG